jgi:hypothetical protein
VLQLKSSLSSLLDWVVTFVPNFYLFIFLMIGNQANLIKKRKSPLVQRKYTKRTQKKPPIKPPAET